MATTYRFREKPYTLIEHLTSRCNKVNLYGLKCGLDATDEHKDGHLYLGQKATELFKAIQ